MSDMTHQTVPVEPTAEMIAAIEGHLLTTSRGAILNIKSGLKAAIEAAPPSPVTELEVMLYEALIKLIKECERSDKASLAYCGQTFFYPTPMPECRAALAAYEAKKGAV